MRPIGVRERVGAIVEHEQAIVASWSTRRLRVDLRRFVSSCALLGYMDHSAVVPLRGLRAVEQDLTDPTQLRTHSDFERRCLALVERLRPEVASLLPRIDAVSLVELHAVEPVLVDLAPRMILGDTGPDRYFDLICWNQANALAEDVQRPYWAATGISRESVYHPADRFGLVEPMTELRIRYEDEPERRDDTARDIMTVLDAFLTAAPWPLPEAVR